MTENKLGLADKETQEDINKVLLSLYDFLIDAGYLTQDNVLVTYNALVRFLCLFTTIQRVSEEQLLKLIKNYIKVYQESEKKMASFDMGIEPDKLN